MDEQQPVTLKRATRGLSLPLVVTALVLYFGYFAVYGKHGLVNWIRLNHEIELKQAEFDVIHAERQALEHRVRLLRPESVDPDLLEEQARARLGLSEPDEVVILKDKR
jgi:cell division protein FtsB